MFDGFSIAEAVIFTTAAPDELQRLCHANHSAKSKHPETYVREVSDFVLRQNEPDASSPVKLKSKSTAWKWLQESWKCDGF